MKTTVITDEESALTLISADDGSVRHKENLKRAVRLKSSFNYLRTEVLTFTEMISFYSVQLTESADIFMLEEAETLDEIRAAIFACRKRKKKLYVFISVSEDGRTEELRLSPLSILICAQELGLEGFGVSSKSECGIMTALAEIIPYAKIPLILKCEKTDISLSENLIQKYDTENSEELLCFSGYGESYFLNPDTTEISEPLKCHPNMQEEITDICEGNYDILRVLILTPEDSADFAENAQYAQLPVMFTSNDKLALKAALMLYQGRAMIDRDSQIESEELEKISRKYGAVIY